MANEQFNGSIAAPAGGELSTNRVLKNTYMLLAATLAFAAVTGGVAMNLDLPRIGFIPFFAIFMGLSFLVGKTANSGWGLVSVFLLTGFLGAQLGSVVSMYAGLPNGEAIVAQAFGLTAFVFMGLSAYVVTTKADFSFLRGFIMVGSMLAFGLCLIYAGMIMFDVSLTTPMQLAVSSFFVLFSSAVILWQTSEIVQGGETNYIMATSMLFMSIYNLLMSLLSIFGIMGDD